MLRISNYYNYHACKSMKPGEFKKKTNRNYHLEKPTILIFYSGSRKVFKCLNGFTQIREVN